MPTLTPTVIPAGTLAALAQPELDRDGVVLRPWRATDRAAVVTAYGDPDIQRWHCRSMTDDEARDWIASWRDQWRTESGASWAVLRHGEVAGQIGLRRIRLDEGLAAVSYWVLPAHRGTRTAPQALAALTTWSFATLGLHRMELCHSTANVPSCRVAQRAGFAEEGTKRAEARHADGWHDMHLHARLATD